MTTNHTTGHDKAVVERARRFRGAAMPCLDDAYRFACFLLRNRADAEDAVERCYLHALSDFESWPGGAIRPWLFSILRRICYSEFAGRIRLDAPLCLTDREHTDAPRFLQEQPAQHDLEKGDWQEGAAIRKLVYSLPASLVEVIVMREFIGMSYREIAEVIEAPIGTVISRLAQARELLSNGWQTKNKAA